MEENLKTKNSKGLIVLLVIIIIALIGFIVVDKFVITDNKVQIEEKENNNNKEEKYLMDDLIGHYTYILENTNEGSENNLKYHLDLLDNGLFVYGEDNGVANNNIIGNYYVKENNIVLNYLFDSGVIGGPSLLTIKGQRIINIVNENEIVDNNIGIGDEYHNVDPTYPESDKNYSKKEIKLTKDSKEAGTYTSSSLMEEITSEDTVLLNKGSERP